MELLIGCGSSREKRMGLAPSRELDPGWEDLVTLDFNADHEPDVVWDLNKTPWPFDDDTFDEIHAYEVLEHLGQQGDEESFFAHFSEIWRLLKPDGVLCATCPSVDSRWAWGDPSHKRVISQESLVFLSQAQYEAQVGKTPMSDFRYLYKADFEPLWLDDTDGTFSFILTARKGAR